ncbi:hypothetical protein CspeluHIS016_0501890 [Cutaneotrichosporon spelunceum]|uniref:Uncharacterized protein n=1 Tax=Cutaneotrichosporon spelunceum TaxID=1672016 RepID=A0AAD3TWH6_9TREE|nr:hypothetical protein CspeluHIS016_0501890 [Cutaneotrichosporon spelunceum]
MLAALFTLLPAFTGLAAAAPVPGDHDTSSADDWTPYPDPNPTPAHPDYAWPDHDHKGEAWAPSYKTGCDVSTLHLPKYAYDNHTADWDHGELMVPEDQRLKIVTIGRGVQTYTCKSGVYVSTGAMADLYDTSCILSRADDYQSFAANLPYYAYDAVPYPWPEHENPYRYIKHEFVEYQGENVPKWTRTDGYYMYGKKVGSYSPDEKNIPWLRLEYLPIEAGNEDHLLAKTVLRTDTVGGVPPPSCHEEGKAISVPYAANYYFYA